MDLSVGGCNYYDLHSLRLRPAGAESCPNVAPIRSVEVPPSSAKQARLRRPGATAQHLVSAEPGLRVFAVRIDLESRVWLEVAGGPLPDVADHMAAAEGAVAFRKCADIYGAHRAPAQISPLQSQRVIAPGKAAFHSPGFLAQIPRHG